MGYQDEHSVFYVKMFVRYLYLENIIHKSDNETNDQLQTIVNN